MHAANCSARELEQGCSREANFRNVEIKYCRWEIAAARNRGQSIRGVNERLDRSPDRDALSVSEGRRPQPPGRWPDLFPR
jgi:hypothetical protein